MKRHTIVALAVLAVVALVPAGALAQGARLRLDSLDKLTDQAEEVVDVTIDQSMLSLASQFLPNKGDQAAVKQILSELRGVFVKVFEFSGRRDLTAELEPIRRQLTSQGSNWTRLVSAGSRRDGELVEVYMYREKDQNGGIAVLAADGNELTVVNIVGPIDPAKLLALRGQLGIPDLSDVVKDAGR